MHWALGTIVILLVYGAVAVVARLAPLARAERAFWAAYRTRMPISDDDFCAKEFPDLTTLRDVPCKVRTIFAEQLDLEVELLRADDDFLFYFAEMDAAELVMDVEERFDVVLNDTDLSSVPCTIRGATQLVLAKLALKPGASSMTME